MVEPLSENGLTFQFHTEYTKNAMDKPVTGAVLEHILRTILQVITDAYYRAGYLTTEHTILELQKTALEKAIVALKREMSSTSEHTLQESGTV
jgi:hypothetical protein